MSIAVIVNLTIFVFILLFLFRQQTKATTLSRQVLLGLVFGSAFSLIIHMFYGEGNPVISETLAWVNVVGSGYVGLLKMVIMPLVLVSMIAAVVKLENSGSLGKISALTIGVLLFTTIIAALIGIAVTQIFGFSAAGLFEGVRETTR